MKNVILIFSILSFTVFSSCISVNSEAKKRPLAKIEKVSIDSVSLDAITLKIDLTINNPYILSIDINKAIMETYVENERLIHTSSGSPFNVRGGEISPVSFKVKLKWADLDKASSNYVEKDYLTIKIISVVDVKLPEIPGLPESVMLSYTTEKIIPALKPEVSFKNFNLIFPKKDAVAKALVKAKKSPLALVRILGLFAGKENEEAAKDLSDLDLMISLNFDIIIENKAKGKVNIDSIHYIVKYNNITFISGDTELLLNEGQISKARMGNDFNTRSFHKAMISLFNEKNRDFKVEGYAVMLFPKEISDKPVRFNFGKD